MRTLNYYPILLVAGILSVLSSCKKDSSATKTTTTTATLTVSGAISLGTVATTSATGVTTKDSLYLVNCFTPHSKKDSVAFSALPTAIGTYLTANYPGYTFGKAFKILDSLGVLNSYIVVIKYNGNPVGLKFTATGTFVQVLEQMVGPGPGGRGFNPNGGPFGGRDGQHPDTIALSAIPSAVTAYFTKTYPADTLLHAAIAPDSTYVLISKDSGLFATAITKTGTLVNRTQIQRPEGKPPVPIHKADLPAVILTYLTSTYPGYIFDQAFAASKNGAIQGYLVLITSNSTNYAVQFDASGTFVSAVAIH